MNGNSTNPEAVCDLAHKNGLDIFSIILSEWLTFDFFHPTENAFPMRNISSEVNHKRPNYLKNMNEEFIEKTLCRDARRYLKVYSENFEEDMKKAMDSVISQIGAFRGPLSE